MKVAAGKMISFHDDSSDRRRVFVRRPVQLRASVLVDGRELSAMAENISPGGAFLRVELPPGMTSIEASILLPHGKDLRVRAKVRWRSGDPHGVGIEFDQFLG